MENTSKLSPVSDRDVFYYRQRSKNRVFEALTAFFAEEAENRGLSKKDIAECLRRDPAQITRWLTSPSNLTLDTISDLLLSLGAEMEYFVQRVDARGISNEMHPLLQKIGQRTLIQIEDKREKLPKARYSKIHLVESNAAPTVARQPEPV